MIEIPVKTKLDVPDSLRLICHMNPEQSFATVGRRTPASGVFIASGHPTIVFLTLCTRNRHPWLAAPEPHQVLRAVWSRFDAWLVGFYLLMPDHLHLFCAPHDLNYRLEQWVKCWKSHCTRRLKRPDWRWQTGYWDTRLRRGESYGEKWQYVAQNPVRKGLVSQAKDWPFQGQLNVLRW